MTDNDIPMAFPQNEFSAYTTDRTGMTLRDWFAGQALAWLPHVGCGPDLDNRETAEAAYQLADAMLAERAVKDTSYGR